MKIAILSKKGGVGKTPFAFSLAKDLNLSLQSNDNSCIEKIYPNKAKISKIVDNIDNCVYDFGGFSASGVLSIVKDCKFCLIPVLPNSNSLIKTVETIKELKNINNNIILLATNYRNDREKEYLENHINNYFNQYPVFYFKSSMILSNAMFYGRSFLDLYNENQLSKNAYKNFIDEYEKLLNKITLKKP